MSLVASQSIGKCGFSNRLRLVTSLTMRQFEIVRTFEYPWYARLVMSLASTRMQRFKIYLLTKPKPN